VRICFSIAILIIPLSLLAQLSAPGSTSVRFTTYLSDPGVRDQVFIYCDATGTQKGTLNAVSPGGSGPFNFTWYKWSDVSDSFSILLKSES